MEIIDVKVIVESPEFKPSYESKQAAGADVRACINEPVEIAPGERKLISTGVKMAIPVGYEIQVRPRSGAALKRGITVLNTPGTVDADYRGTVGVILINHGYETVTIEPKERIAQLVLKEVPQANFIITDSLDETERGEGGFESTGK